MSRAEWKGLLDDVEQLKTISPHVKEDLLEEYEHVVPRMRDAYLDSVHAFFEAGLPKGRRIPDWRRHGGLSRQLVRWCCCRPCRNFFRDTLQAFVPYNPELQDALGCCVLVLVVLIPCSISIVIWQSFFLAFQVEIDAVQLESTQLLNDDPDSTQLLNHEPGWRPMPMSYMRDYHRSLFYSETCDLPQPKQVEDPFRLHLSSLPLRQIAVFCFWCSATALACICCSSLQDDLRREAALSDLLDSNPIAAPGGKQSKPKAAPRAKGKPTKASANTRSTEDSESSVADGRSADTAAQKILASKALDSKKKQRLPGVGRVPVSVVAEAVLPDEIQKTPTSCVLKKSAPDEAQDDSTNWVEVAYSPLSKRRMSKLARNHSTAVTKKPDPHQPARKSEEATPKDSPDQGEMSNLDDTAPDDDTSAACSPEAGSQCRGSRRQDDETSAASTTEAASQCRVSRRQDDGTSAASNTEAVTADAGPPETGKQTTAKSQSPSVASKKVEVSDVCVQTEASSLLQIKSGDLVSALSSYSPPDQGYLQLRRGMRVLVQYVGDQESSDEGGYLFGRAVGEQWQGAQGWFPAWAITPGLGKTVASIQEDSAAGIDLDCIVCMAHPRVVLCLPCSHLPVCSNCWKSLAGLASMARLRPKCPLCRTIIERVHTVIL